MPRQAILNKPREFQTHADPDRRVGEGLAGRVGGEWKKLGVWNMTTFIICINCQIIKQFLKYLC